MPIKTYNVNSSAITTIEYDSDTETATVVFRKSGKTDTLNGISPDVMQEWLDSPSIGKFYVDNFQQYV